MITRGILALWICAAGAQACILVEGDRILGGDMAAANAAFVGIGAATDFGPSPSVGTRRTLKRLELERIASRNEVILAADSAEACFDRITVRLSDELLHQALAVVLPDPFQILDFSRSLLPVGKPEFRIEGLAASGLWRGRWLFGENRSVPVWVRIQVTRSGLPVAVKVERGDTVRVEVRSGGVLLSFDAAAENSGHLGEPIMVRNPDNGRRFRSIVEAPGRVGIHK